MSNKIKPITVERLNRVIMAILQSPNKSGQRGAMWAKLATMRSRILDNQLEQMSKTVINFFEGSYCFNTIETTLNVSPDFIEMKLAKQYEYRETKSTLWAEMIKGNEITRFQLEYGTGLIKKA